MIITNSQLRKVINEELQIVLVEQRMELWEQRTTRELDKLLSEVDLKGATSAALEKINNFVLKLSIKAMDFASKGKKAALRAVKIVSGAISKVTTFAKNNPTLVKIGLGILSGVLLHAVSSVFTASDAQAAIEMGGEVLTDQNFELLIGYLRDAMDNLRSSRFPGGARAVREVTDFIETAREAQAATEVIPIENLQGGGWLDAADTLINDTIRELGAQGEAGEETAKELMRTWQRKGARTTDTAIRGGEMF
jgi:hypothetical protein